MALYNLMSRVFSPRSIPARDPAGLNWSRPVSGSGYGQTRSSIYGPSMGMVPTTGRGTQGRVFRRPSLSERFYGNRTPQGILSTGFGATRPKLLSMRRFTSRWLSPSEPGSPSRGLLRPNPLYETGTTVGWGRGFGGPGMGTYSSYAARNLPFMRSTI